MKKVLFLIACSFVASIDLLLAQDFELPKVIAPSPNSSAMGKFIDVPVSTYTGVPNISVPIYEIKDKDLSLPIMMNYHAGGIKVSEISPWTGIGWSLSAGGSITRTIRGLDDLGPGGFFRHDIPTSIPHNPEEIHDDSTDPNVINIIKYANGNRDGEPDIFYYSIPGESGKFILEPSGSGYIGRTIPHTKTSIEITTNASGQQIDKFIVTNTEGMTYTFDVWEEVTSQSVTRVTRSRTADYPNDQIGVNLNIRSTWMLTSIASPSTSANITLEYTDDSNPVRYEVANEVKEYVLLKSSRPDELNNPWQSLANDTKTSSYTLIHVPRRIERINFSQGSIMFSQSDNYRCDVNGDKYLKRINIIDSELNDVREFEFEYSYSQDLRFDADDNTGCTPDTDYDSNVTDRLFLKSITEKSSTIAKPPYLFSYNDAVTLPNRSSTSLDYWGFYNGAVNATLIPLTFFSDDEGITSIIGDADRTPSLTHTKAGVLDKITYPTGGHVVFNYELNESELTPDYVRYRSFDDELKIFPDEEDVGDEVYFDITINDELLGGSELIIGGKNFPADHEDLSGTYDLPFQIQVDEIDPGTGSVIRANVHLVDRGGFRTWSWVDGNLEDPFPPFLTNGTYRVKHVVAVGFNSNYDQDISKWYRDRGGDISLPMEFPVLPRDRPGNNNGDIIYRDVLPYTLEVRWRESYNSNTKDVGGLRIGSIDYYAENGDISFSKNYDYSDDEGNATGYLTTLPGHFEPYNELVRSSYQIIPGQGGYDVIDYTNNFLVMKSSSFYPLGSTNSSTVGYGQVSVSQEGNGKSIFYYTNPKSHPDDIDHPSLLPIISRPYAPVNKQDWRRGLMTAEATYNQGMTNKVDSIQNEYTHYLTGTNLISAKGISVARRDAGLTITSNFFRDQITTDQAFDYAAKFFFTKSGRVEQSSSEQFQYDLNDDTKSFSDLMTYTYDPDNLQMRSESRTNSEGETVETAYYYPTDYAAPSGSMMNTMVTKNMINRPIETITLVDDDVVGASVNHYDYDATNELVTLESVDHLNNDQPVSDYSYSSDAINFDSRFEPKASFTYDNEGNIESLAKDKDVNTTFAWKYDSELPVIKVINPGTTFSSTYESASVLPSGYSTLEDLLASLDNVGLNTTQRSRWNSYNQALRAHSANKGALIYTYTYDKLIGITSETGPNGLSRYYIYDALGRLVRVKDHSGNTVQEYSYEYGISQ